MWQRITIMIGAVIILTCSGFFLYDYSTMWDSVPSNKPPSVVEPGEPVPEPSERDSKTVVVEVPKDTPERDIEVRQCDPTLKSLEGLC